MPTEALVATPVAPARIGNSTTSPAAPVPPAAPGRRIRVAFVITRADSLGGATVHVRDMSRVLLAAGHEVLVLVGGEGPVTEALRQAGVPYRSLRHLQRSVSPRADLAALWELRSALASYRPDLVSTHTSKAGFLGRIAAWSLRLPSLYTPHCWSFVDGFPGAKLYLWVERLARPFGRRIIMVSEAERQEGLAKRVGSAQHLVTVHNGMPDIDERFRADPGVTPPRILMVGRCEPQKDHLSLLRALAQLKDQAWSLTCIGDGPLRPEVEAEIARLGLADRVTMLGYCPNVRDVLQQSQIFALITHWESFPRSILEAMRAGLPVIASNVGGTAESVEHGNTGYIVPRGDVDSIAAHLRQLISDTELRVRFGVAARQRYEERFTLNRMVRETVHVWGDVLGQRIAMGQPAQPAVANAAQR